MGRAHGNTGGPSPGDDRVDRVVVCRGGECGDRRKHPGFDHRAQLQRFIAELGPDVPVIPAACLEACEHSNVVVVVPAKGHSRYPPEPVWIGEVLEEQTTEEIIAWVRGGELDAADMPVSAEIARFTPTRLNRGELVRLLDKQGRRRR